MVRGVGVGVARTYPAQHCYYCHWPLGAMGGDLYIIDFLRKEHDSSRGEEC